MAYVSLYRKYRSQTFAEVLGQEHVTRTLSQAITEDRISHAYLFTGPRGTGKTSTARILAKSLNCEQGPTPDPCGKCTQCVSITEGSSVDVIEIDAASHGGVDDVRDLRDRVNFAPASARKKVYIVDECHMLSTAGWNAFLKTVEEPPDHVVFVFATTEPHKVLDTILSRTQRFDFKRMAAAVLAAHVADLGAREGMTFEPGAIDLIVAAGDGSARDTLSVLDQVVAFTGPSITARGVAEVLGAVPAELLFDAADLIGEGDVAGVCMLVGRLADAGHDLRQFSRELVEHLRRLFLLQVAPEGGLVEGTAEALARLQAQAGRLGRVELLRSIELLAEAQAQMRRGNTRLPLEIALAKAALPEASGDPGALAARLDRLERRTGVGEPASASAAPAPVTTPAPAPVTTPAPAPVARAPEPAPVSRDPAPAATARTTEPAPTTEPADAPASRAPEPAPVTEPAEARDSGDGGVPTAIPETPVATRPVDLDLIKESWPAILASVKRRKRTLRAWLDASHPVSLRGDTLGLQFRYGFHAENCARDDSQDLLGEVFTEILGRRLRVDCSVVEVDDPPERVANDDVSLAEQASAVLEQEAAAAAGVVPDEAEVHERALQTLTRDLGATVVDDGERQ